MKDAFGKITEQISKITDLLLSLIILGIVIGILFPDAERFNVVINGIGALMSQFGENGLAGLLALILIVIWYQKK